MTSASGWSHLRAAALLIALALPGFVRGADALPKITPMTQAERDSAAKAAAAKAPPPAASGTQSAPAPAAPATGAATTGAAATGSAPAPAATSAPPAAAPKALPLSAAERQRIRSEIERELKLMADSLALTPSQRSNARPILLDHAYQVKQMGERYATQERTPPVVDAMQKEMQVLRDTTDSKLSRVLTPTQLTQYRMKRDLWVARARSKAGVSAPNQAAPVTPPATVPTATSPPAQVAPNTAARPDTIVRPDSTARPDTTRR